MRLAMTLFACALGIAGGWYLSGYALHRDQTPPVYDHQVAYRLASVRIPAHRQSYFMVNLNDLGDADKQAAQLAKNLGKINHEKNYLGLIGADPEHNRAVLQKLNHRIAHKQYPDIKLIVVGPPDAEAMLRRAAGPLASNMRYVAYP